MNDSMAEDKPGDASPPAGGAAGGQGEGSANDAATSTPGAGPGDASAPPPPAGGRDAEMLRDILLFLPRFAALLGKLLVDGEVAAGDKLLLGAAVLYIASPLDIIPDFIPVIGQLDDIYLVALCLLRLMNRSGAAKLRQHWDGPEDIVHILDTVTDVATRYLPGPARDALRGWIEARTGGSSGA